MRFTTFFPSKVWNFALYISTLLILLFKSIEFVIFGGKISEGILNGLFQSISHFLIGCTFGLICYFFFAKIGNELIEKGNINFEKKLFLNIYGFMLSFFLWGINLLFFSFIEKINFFAPLFFISMTFAIWYYDIKMEIVSEESVEGILDDNFIVPRK
ncbi:MAG: hypothetical protein AB8F94_24410 [Saprospiraceae bacterium]